MSANRLALQSPEEILKYASGDELAQLQHVVLTAQNVSEIERMEALAIIGNELRMRRDEPFTRSAERWFVRHQGAVKSLCLGIVGGMIGADLSD